MRDHMRDVVHGGGAPRGFMAESLRFAGVAEKTIERGGERHRIPRCDQKSRVAVPKRRGYLPDARGDDWAAREHRFEQGKGQTLREGGHHKDVCTGEQVRNVGPQSQEMDLLGKPLPACQRLQLVRELSPPGERQVDARVAITKERERREQYAVAFDGIEIPHGEQQLILALKAELSVQRRI
jgi:hypothetical protein